MNADISVQFRAACSSGPGPSMGGDLGGGGDTVRIINSVLWFFLSL